MTSVRAGRLATAALCAGHASTGPGASAVPLCSECLLKIGHGVPARCTSENSQDTSIDRRHIPCVPHRQRSSSCATSLTHEEQQELASMRFDHCNRCLHRTSEKCGKWWTGEHKVVQGTSYTSRARTNASPGASKVGHRRLEPHDSTDRARREPCEAARERKEAPANAVMVEDTSSPCFTVAGIRMRARREDSRGSFHLQPTQQHQTTPVRART